MQTATITKTRALTNDALELTFDSAFDFIAGQYLTLECTIDGQNLRRCYSLSSPPYSHENRVVVKRVQGGQMSNYIHENARAGWQLNLLRPMGAFKLMNHTPAKDSNITELVFFAIGSGITPIMAMILQAFHDDAGVVITLFYGNRTEEDIIYNEELQDLKNTYQNRFILHNFLSRASSDFALYNGRMDGQKLQLCIEKGILTTNAKGYYICGTDEMSTELSATLKSHGVNESIIKREIFTPSPADKNAKPIQTKAHPNLAQESVKIMVQIDGVQKYFTLQHGENIIDSAQKAGINLPFSCRGGMCSTCRCHVAQGEFAMELNYALENWELAQGFALACQIIPKTSALTLDFDKH